MSSIEIISGKLFGFVTIPSSKSVGHRALICAALSKGSCTVSNITFSKDINATLNALSSLGSKFTVSDDSVSFYGFEPNGNAQINCGESGSTLRFLIPVISALGIDCVLNGEGKLPIRPLDEYERLLGDKVKFHLTDGHLPLSLSGKLSLDKALVKGDISSQYITGLLLASPLFGTDFEIILTTKLLSKPYIDITLSVLSEFGIQAEETDNGYFVKGNQKFKSNDYHVEGDFSSAAFWLCANYLNNTITLSGLHFSSKQGDKAILDILPHFGKENLIIDGGQIPDLIPVLAVTAAGFSHDTIFKGCERLKYKESDRLYTTADMLTRLGGSVETTQDGFIVHGTGRLSGGLVDAHNDHRIAMSAAIASTICEGKVIIEGYECADKSYPAFFKDFIQLGGKVNEQFLG